MKAVFQVLLYTSLYALIYSMVVALAYEIYAATTGQVTVISNIIIPWVKLHNLYASLIVGAISGFLMFLIVHFFGART